MKKVQRILAIIGIIVLVGLYLSTLVLLFWGRIFSLCSWQPFFPALCCLCSFGHMGLSTG